MACAGTVCDRLADGPAARPGDPVRLPCRQHGNTFRITGFPCQSSEQGGHFGQAGPRRGRKPSTLRHRRAANPTTRAASSEQPTPDSTRNAAFPALCGVPDPGRVAARPTPPPHPSARHTLRQSMMDPPAGRHMTLWGIYACRSLYVRSRSLECDMPGHVSRIADRDRRDAPELRDDRPLPARYPEHTNVLFGPTSSRPSRRLRRRAASRHAPSHQRDRGPRPRPRPRATPTTMPDFSSNSSLGARRPCPEAPPSDPPRPWHRSQR